MYNQLAWQCVCPLLHFRSSFSWLRKMQVFHNLGLFTVWLICRYLDFAKFWTLNGWKPFVYQLGNLTPVLLVLRTHRVPSYLDLWSFDLFTFRGIPLTFRQNSMLLTETTLTVSTTQNIWLKNVSKLWSTSRFLILRQPWLYSYGPMLYSKYRKFWGVCED